MNDKKIYSEMLDIPASCCNITYKPPKKHPIRKFFKKREVQGEEQIKKLVIDKVNNEEITTSEAENCEQIEVIEDELEQERKEESLCEIKKATQKKKSKLGIVGVQFIVIGLLFVAIIITNALSSTSGLSVFFNGVFGSEQLVDSRTYSEFTPVFSSDATLEQGVVYLKEDASIYAPCTGIIKSIEKDEKGNYNVSIMHSENFYSYIGDLTYVYAEVGDTVYNTVPMGYSNNSAKAYFLDNGGNVLTSYTLSSGEVKWA